MASIVDGPYVPESEHYCPRDCPTHSTEDQQSRQYNQTPERRQAREKNKK